MPVPFLLRQQNQVYRQFLERGFHFWADKSSKLLVPYIRGNKILDIGLGPGVISKILKNRGYHIEGLDVVDISIYPDIKPTLYDGIHFPYKNKQFDTGLFLHVLHHCHDQESVLREAARTCRRLIIIEDTYCDRYEKWITTINDCYSNFEFYPHPYHSVLEWNQIFIKYHLKLIYQSEFYRRPTFFPLPVHYVLFVVEQ